MRTRFAQFSSEVVSLTMMALLIVALASGQAAGVAAPHRAAAQTMAASESFSVRHEGE